MTTSLLDKHSTQGKRSNSVYPGKHVILERRGQGRAIRSRLGRARIGSAHRGARRRDAARSGAEGEVDIIYIMVKFSRTHSCGGGARPRAGNFPIMLIMFHSGGREAWSRRKRARRAGPFGFGGGSADSPPPGSPSLKVATSKASRRPPRGERWRPLVDDNSRRLCTQ